MVMIGQDFPNFQAKSTVGDIQFYDWVGESWCILVSFTKDFDVLCSDEIMGIVNLMTELRRNNVKPLAISCDTVQTHLQWITSLHISHGNRSGEFPFPIIEDPSRRLSSLLGILDMGRLDEYKCPLAGRAVFLIDPAKKLRLKLIYPANITRNHMEVMRTLTKLQDQDRMNHDIDVQDQERKIKTRRGLK